METSCRCRLCLRNVDEGLGRDGYDTSAASRRSVCIVSLRVVAVAGQGVVRSPGRIGQASATRRQWTVVVGHGELGDGLDSRDLDGKRARSRSLKIVAGSAVAPRKAGDEPASVGRCSALFHFDRQRMICLRAQAIATLCNVVVAAAAAVGDISLHHHHHHGKHLRPTLQEGVISYSTNCSAVGSAGSRSVAANSAASKLPLFPTCSKVCAAKRTRLLVVVEWACRWTLDA